MLRPRHPAATPVRRGFVRLPQGDVHYRAAGAGPAVLALHESPRSSLSLLPVIDALADRFHVIAPDTPGYGLSDPLPGDAPTLDAFVQAIADLLDAFGLHRVAIYGAHTGAALALAFAQRHPERVTALALDGVSAFDAAEVEAFRSRYLEPWSPSWDGAHVMRLWSRSKDLFTWFPWYERAAGRRLIHEPPALEGLHRSALGFLQAGRHYAEAYAHAAAFRPAPALAALACPATIMARPDDLIADHLARLGSPPADAGWRVEALSADPDAWCAALRQALSQGDTPGPVVAPPHHPEGSRLVRLGGGDLHVILRGVPDGPLRLLLPGLPSDVRGLLAREHAAHPGARLAVFSPPGCGWSDPAARTDGLAGVVEALEAAREAMGLGAPASLAGEGASAVLAEMWAAQAGWMLPAEAIDPPAWLAPDNPPPTSPLLQPLAARWDGANLMGAWFQIRDLALYDTPPGAGPALRRGDGGEPPLAELEARFRSYVEGPECAEVLDAVVAEVSRRRGA